MDCKKLLMCLADKVVDVLDGKAKVEWSGDRSWTGFQNANGDEIGEDIEEIIRIAKKILDGEVKS